MAASGSHCESQLYFHYVKVHFSTELRYGVIVSTFHTDLEFGVPLKETWK